MKSTLRFSRFLLLSAGLIGTQCQPPATDTTAGAAGVTIRQAGNTVTIENAQLSVAYDLGTGYYRAVDKRRNLTGLDSAWHQAGPWKGTAPGTKHSWKSTDVQDPTGEGKMLLITSARAGQPDLLLGITLYQDKPFLTLAPGVQNSTGDTLHLRSLKPLAGGRAFGGMDCGENFNLLDGYGGGEATFVTKGAPLRSRNNLLLTFGNPQNHHSLVMGGLTYQDFEKFAVVEPDQTRLEALQAKAEAGQRVLTYLDLGKETETADGPGPGLRVATGSPHPFDAAPDPAIASVAYDREAVVIDVKGLDPAKAYSFGFSWADDGTSRIQAVKAEDGSGGQARVLLKDHSLPSLAKEQHPEEIGLNLPGEVYRDGKAKLTFSRVKGPNVVVSEIWLAEGEVPDGIAGKPTLFQAAKPTYRNLRLHLLAEDPVGKRVDPGGRYFPGKDRFYLDFSIDNPYEALEAYGQGVKTAQGVKLNPYDFPTVCLWYAMHWNYGDGPSVNDSPGAVDEMDRIVKSGFLKYAKAAVRLVPDCYDENNEQGWWDDKHWQMYGSGTTSNEVKVKPGHYKPPYETTQKWGRAITERGGIPITYVQTGKRSQDYAETFPHHMLFNQANARVPDNDWTVRGLGSYDFTDPDFLKHMREVYANLRSGGVRGLMFDYPNTGWAAWGGMEDKYSTTGAAYRTIYQLAYDGLGPDCYIHERNLDRGADLTLGLVASQRTWGDTDDVTPEMVTRSGLRWYKNRVVVNYDMDAKNLLKAKPANRDGVRKLLTMAYVASGRLLLANSFAKLSPDYIHDLSRIYPFHAQPQSARPVDAFTNRFPQVYDFAVSPEWHQLTFYNTDNEKATRVGVDFAGHTAFGGLGLAADRSYYVYDFWNDKLVGKVPGRGRFEQELRPGEARILSVRAAADHPQVLSTNRHLMQGYVELSDVTWDAAGNKLSGKAKVVGGEPLVVTLALNGYRATGSEAKDGKSTVTPAGAPDGLARLTLETAENAQVEWTVSFGKQ
jgi:hypothetical protein